MRKFLIKISLYVFPFILMYIHFTFVVKNVSGDIGRLGMIPFGNNDVKCELPSNDRVISCYGFDELKNAEIISVGDSFNKIGENACFLNYIGNRIDKDIYRLQTTLGDYRLIDTLIRNNLIPHCNVLIVESVERSIIDRLNHKYYEQEIKFDSVNKTINKVNKVKNGINEFMSYLRLKVGYKNPIKSIRLKGDFFTCDYSKRELFFLDSEEDSDLAFRNISEDEYEKAYQNLIKLKDFVELNGIKLIYVVAVDKYDLYSGFLTDNKYGYNPTLDYFKDMDTAFLVDTKLLLEPYLKNGVKDVYLANDTHWSPIGAEIVGNYIAEIIKNEGCITK